MEKKGAELYQDSYPIKYKSMAMVNGGWLLGTVIGMCKLFLKKKLADRIRTLTTEELVVGGKEGGGGGGGVANRKTDHTGCCAFNSWEDLPVFLNGTYRRGLREWVVERHALRVVLEANMEEWAEEQEGVKGGGDVVL